MEERVPIYQYLTMGGLSIFYIPICHIPSVSTSWCYWIQICQCFSLVYCVLLCIFNMPEIPHQILPMGIIWNQGLGTRMYHIKATNGKYPTSSFLYMCRTMPYVTREIKDHLFLANVRTFMDIQSWFGHWSIATTCIWLCSLGIFISLILIYIFLSSHRLL